MQSEAAVDAVGVAASSSSHEVLVVGRLVIRHLPSSPPEATAMHRTPDSSQWEWPGGVTTVPAGCGVDSAGIS